MAKPPVAYGNQVKLAPPPTGTPSLGTAPHSPTSEPSPSARRRSMESRADPTILYLHPDGKYELKRYALARGPKVKESWLGLFGQVFRLDRWSVCRVQAAAICGRRVK
jgi:hypothetical protein